MLCEVLEAFDYFVPEAPYEGQRGISARGENFGRVPRTDARLIFTAADVAHVMKTVLDAPVRVWQSEQLFGTHALSGEAGDGVDGFDGFLTAHDAPAGNAADLRHTGPKWVQISSQHRGRFHPAGLNPAMALLGRFASLEVRRRRQYCRGGKRPEGLRDVRLQCGLVGFDSEEIIPAAVDDDFADSRWVNIASPVLVAPFSGSVFSNCSTPAISLASGSTRNWPIMLCKRALNAASGCVPGGLRRGAATQPLPINCHAAGRRRALDPVAQRLFQRGDIQLLDQFTPNRWGGNPFAADANRRERFTAQPPFPADDAQLIAPARPRRRDRDQQEAGQREALAFGLPVVGDRRKRIPKAARLRWVRSQPRIP